jgi:hypothetical protein
MHTQLAPSAPTRADAEAALQLFSHDLLQDVPVQRQVRHQPLELGLLIAQLPQLPQLAQRQSRVFLPPDVERSFADPVLAADVGDPLAALRLLKRPRNLSSPCPFFRTFAMRCGRFDFQPRMAMP